MRPARRVVLDLFSGCGGVTAAAKRQGGAGEQFEIEKGPQYDLTSSTVVEPLLAAIRNSSYRGVMIATPCTSWTIARDRNSQIRTRNYLWGLPGLPKQLKHVVQLGNNCARTTEKVLCECLESGTKGILENPATSRLFLLKSMRRLLNKYPDKVSFVVGDFCQFGTPWKKPTGFLCVNIAPADVALLGRRCTKTNGCCNKTGKPHIVLSGTSPQGVPWTRVAQPYPNALCSLLAKILLA